MTYRRLLGAALFIALLALSIGQTFGVENPAVNAPDEFAWELFIQVNLPVKDGTNNVLWETWADDGETFPSSPDPSAPPAWPGALKRAKTFRSSRQIEFLKRQLQGQGLLGAEGPHPLIAVSGNQEEVRRNKATFDFIVSKKLWYLDGIVNSLKAGESVDFPPDAIEVKAHWKKIDERDKPRYHWNTDGSGQLFGLVALHISSKALPDWFWATFEHVDNPERGKVLGCQDSFGVTPPKSCSGTVSKALIDKFNKAGMGTEWQSYRLDGPQTAFTDSTGRPTLLGNSDIEGPFMTTSSCITCHARAAADVSGVFLSIFKPGGPPEGFVGTPDPAWYYNSDGTRKNIQLDFVWGFLAANPVSAKK